MKRYDTIKSFFSLSVLWFRIGYTTVNSWVVTDLSLMLNHFLITGDVFVVVIS